jgi:hypothetical protein
VVAIGTASASEVISSLGLVAATSSVPISPTNCCSSKNLFLGGRVSKEVFVTSMLVSCRVDASSKDIGSSGGQAVIVLEDCDMGRKIRS